MIPHPSRWRAARDQMMSGPMPWLAGVSLLGLTIQLVKPNADTIAAICGRVDLRVLIDPSAWGVVLNPYTMFFDWSVMLLLMMPLLLSQPIGHVLRLNLKIYKTVSVFIFSLAYFSIFVAAGVVLIPTAMLVSYFTFDDFLLAVFAILWSASPLAQSFRNLCHKYEAISVRGGRWLYGHVQAGWRHGTRCLMVCWPWMMLPLLIETAHTFAMIFVTLYLLSDRLAPAGTIRWRLPPALSMLWPIPAHRQPH